MSSHAPVHRTLLSRPATADLFRMRDQRAALSHHSSRGVTRLGEMDPSGSGSWLSRTLFLRNETLIGHEDPIMVASTLRAPLLRFVY